MDPMIEEFCRVRTAQDIRQDVLRRWQSYLRDEVNPKLERLALIEAGEGVRVRRTAKEATA
jgi:hypothetical protein